MKPLIMSFCVVCLLLLLSQNNPSIIAQDEFPIVTPEAVLIEPAVASVSSDVSFELLGPLVLRERTSIRTGPGLTFEEIGTMGWWNQEIYVIERNRLGNWVRTISWDGQMDGWVRTGHLLFEDSPLRLSDVPVNLTVNDADLDNLWTDTLDYLYGAPLIPEISPRMRAVFDLGQSLGNQANVVTKFGDSLSASPIYLNPITRGDHDLGPYDFLQPTIDFFAPDLVLDSVASRIGLSTYGIFDPFWATDTCESTESPIACEIRLSRPSIALIIFGPNDMRVISEEEYEVQMRLIVEESLNNGVIPVLTTFSSHPNEEYYWVSLRFNSVLIDIATEYEIPLINLWSASRELPDYGLDEDLIHLNHSGFEYLIYSTGHETYYGISLLNLLALRTLDELRVSLQMDVLD